MKFDRGAKVEVFTKKKASLGAWRCAEILADNGESYTIRYCCRPGVYSEFVEKVPLEAVRPCPPSENCPVLLAVGDVIEVLDDGCWKAAMIGEILKEDYYHVHLIGSIDEFSVKKSSIRVRQEWRKDKWVLMEKDHGLCEDMLSRIWKKILLQQHGNYTNVVEILETTMSNSLKRSFSCSSGLDFAFVEPAQKRRAVEKDEAEFSGGAFDSFTAKVDICDLPRNIQGKDCAQTLTKKTNLNMAKGGNQYSYDECLAGTVESENCVSIASSVASCDVSDVDPVREFSHSSSSCSRDYDSFCSDAESVLHFGDDDGVAVKQSVRGNGRRAHEVALSTYRHTLEGLFASGPLNWELELSLTNLRCKLSISNDEHLMELRRLMS